MASADRPDNAVVAASPRPYSTAAALVAYAYHVKVQLLGALAYRFDALVRLASQFVMMLATIFLWDTAYGNVDTVASVDRHQMITFAIVSILMGTFHQDSVQDRIVERLRFGDIAFDLLRPVHPLGCWLSNDLGSAVAALATHLLPLAFIAAFVAHPPLPAGPLAFVVFVPMVLLSFLLNWLLAALMGCLAFWTLELGNLSMVKNVLVRFLSGSIVPLWFFPEWVQAIMNWTPFPYAFQAPLGIYIGRDAPSEALGVIGIQTAWCAGLALVLGYLWRRASSKVLVQGG